MGFAYVYIYVPCSCSAQRGQERVLDLLEVGLHTVVSCYMGAENSTKVH